MDPSQNLSIDYLNLFPDELLLEILIKTENLDTLSRWCQTSKRINNICQDKVLWKQKYQKDFGSSLSGDTILAEGETWKELYKQMVAPSVDSPISAGNNAIGIIDQNGNLYMSGNLNMLGIKPNQIEFGSSGPYLVKFPSKNNNLNHLSQKVISISVGTITVGAVTEDGKAYVWGYNQNNILGFRHNIGIVQSPEEIILPAGTKAIKIETSRLGYIILLENSSVYLRISSYSRIEYQGLLDVKAIDVSIGDSMYTLISKDYKVYIGGYAFVHKLIHLKLPKPARKVIISDRPIIVLTTTGDVYILDSRDNFTDATHGVVNSKLVELPEPIVQISTGGVSFAGLSVTGKLYVWGNNERDKITTNFVMSSKKNRMKINLEPVEISLSLPINFVAVGKDFAIAVSNDGGVNYWKDSDLKPE